MQPLTGQVTVTINKFKKSNNFIKKIISNSNVNLYNRCHVNTKCTQVHFIIHIVQPWPTRKRYILLNVLKCNVFYYHWRTDFIMYDWRQELSVIRYMYIVCTCFYRMLGMQSLYLSVLANGEKRACSSRTK